MSDSVLGALQTAEVAAAVSSHDQQQHEKLRIRPSPWSKFLKFFGWRVEFKNELAHTVTINLSQEARDRQIRNIVDGTGFNGKIFFVAASGFLASSYSLFSTTVTTPALYFVYPPCGRLGNKAGLVIDQLTLVGTVVGMLVVGHAADLWGRKRLYGLELVVIIVATMGLVQAGEGFMYQDNNTSLHSMDIYSWIAWWRTLLGFGIGAEYPISSIITVEWASTESRGTTLAWVKSMQSFARLLAVGIGLGALRNMSNTMHLKPDSLIQGPGAGNSLAFNEGRLIIDRVLRCVIGIALIPAAIAIVSRLTIPESPRYYVDIVKDLRKAVKKALKVHPREVVFENTTEAGPPRQDSIKFNHWYRGMLDYLRDDKVAARNLILITVLWGLMDSGFYGMSLDSFAVLSTLSTVQQNGVLPAKKFEGADGVPCPDSFRWRPATEDRTMNIYQMLDKSAVRSLEIVSLASVLGSLVAILIVNHFHRKRILVVTFLMSAVLFAVTGATLFLAKTGQHHIVTIVFYALTQFVYNVGPNTLIFIIAAEVFPTVYRGTFYGLAAAGGKVGAIIIRAISDKAGNQTRPLSIRLLACVPLMLIAACLSCYLPDVQKPPEKTDAESGNAHAGKANSLGHSALEGVPLPDWAAHTHGPNSQTGHGQVNTTGANNVNGDVNTRRGSTSSSSAASTAPRQRQREPSTWHLLLEKVGLPRLENIPLEDIAPNPSFRKDGGTESKRK